MKFSTRSTYGLRAMIRLAKEADKGSISLSSIAKNENISQKYLEKLFAKLKKQGLVKAVKGAKGGYRLPKKPSQINVYDIIKALEGVAGSFYCLSENGKIYCSSKNRCGAAKVLIKVHQAVKHTLKNTKLSDLI